MDRILIRDLRVRTLIGVRDDERRLPQDVVVNLVLEVDLAAAAASDSLSDTVDYSALSRMVVGHVEGATFKLVEALAGSVADRVLAHDDAIQAVTVRVDKPGAIKIAKSAAIELRRER